MFQVNLSVELNEMWTIPVFYSEIVKPDVSWFENRHNPCGIYFKYDKENYFFPLLSYIVTEQLLKEQKYLQ